MDEDAIRRGSLMWKEPSELTRRYARKCMQRCMLRLDGLSRSSAPSQQSASLLRRDMAFYQAMADLETDINRSLP